MDAVVDAVELGFLIGGVGVDVLDPPSEAAGKKKETNEDRQGGVQSLPDGHFHGSGVEARNGVISRGPEWGCRQVGVFGLGGWTSAGGRRLRSSVWHSLSGATDLGWLGKVCGMRLTDLRVSMTGGGQENKRVCWLGGEGELFTARKRGGAFR